MKTKNYLIYLSIISTLLFACNKNDNNKLLPINPETGFETLRAPASGDVTNLIRPLIFNQFKTGDFTIEKVNFVKDRDALITTIYFKTENNIEGTMIHLKTGKQQIKAGNDLLALNKEYIIDCTGTCGCRERYYPESGAVECTCDQCVMKIIEINP